MAYTGRIGEGRREMDDAAADVVRATHEVLVAAAAEREWWANEVQRQRQEAERWQRRVDLAERHREWDLATQAAQRARHHAGLAVAAEERLAELSNAAHRDPTGAFSERPERIQSP